MASFKLLVRSEFAHILDPVKAQDLYAVEVKALLNWQFEIRSFCQTVVKGLSDLILIELETSEYGDVFIVWADFVDEVFDQASYQRATRIGESAHKLLPLRYFHLELDAPQYPRHKNDGGYNRFHDNIRHIHKQNIFQSIQNIISVLFHGSIL